MGFYDRLETRSADERAKDLARDLPKQVTNAQSNTTAFGESLKGVDPTAIVDRATLATLPVVRKTELATAQSSTPPLGGFNALPTAQVDQLFQSPGRIYEMGQRGNDWWRFGRFLNAVGIGKGDIVQNCYSYHFTPAGMMFENAAQAVGATVFPAGTGQTELQAQAAADLGVTAYAGTPDYLLKILEQADTAGLNLEKLTKAAVSGGPLFPQVRQAYQDRGIACQQCYATADLGHIAYESEAMEGMILDEHVIVEIVTPGTGNPVPDGEIGEVLVTTLNPDYPLIRFSTGDMSSILPGISPCGRTNMRITGWRGRADQATKVKGMFVRPEQVAELVERHPEIARARVEVGHDGKTDTIALKLETNATDVSGFVKTAQGILKIRAEVTLVKPDSLPKDGLVIADLRGAT